MGSFSVQDADDEDEKTLELDPVEANVFCWFCELFRNNGLDLMGNSVLSGSIISSDEEEEDGGSLKKINK